MKKLLCILSAAIILCSCSAANVPISAPADTTVQNQSTEPKHENTTAIPSETENIYDQLPMVAVSLPIIIREAYDDSTNVIFRQTSQSMQLTLRDPEVADKIILDFLNRVDSHSSLATEIEAAAKSSYSADEQWNPYFYDLIYSPTRIDHGVLSLYGQCVSYAGAHHPQTSCAGANYNMITGDVLTLGSILYHIDAKDTLTDLVIEYLDSIAEEKYLLDGYEDIVRQRFKRDESFDEDWYFTNEGLCFYFAPYDIAPYSSGVITAQIPYNKLVGIIADEFFPAEQDLSNGSLKLIPVSEVSDDQFNQITEYIADNDGEMYFIYTDGSIRDINIHMVNTADDDFLPQTEYTVLSTYSLTPGDAIMVKILFDSDGGNSMFVSYKSGNQEYRIALSKDLLNS